MSAHQSPDTIRARFSAAMSAMYRVEVPLYGDLLAIVAEVNRQVVARDPGLAERLGDDLARLGEERHGAIRLGTPAELALIRRAFAVMGMHPVGYYDLSAAGVPVHSTAFRAIDEAALAASPFRVFTSLLRLDLIDDAALRAEATAILAARRIVTPAAMALIEQAEADGGLHAAAAERFVAALLDTFRWQDRAAVDAATYDRLHRAHRLIADVVSFRGAHINHLTPRVLDIDAAQAAMRARGIAAKAVIEGPPPRAVPLLLRQTSFAAIEEAVVFADAAGDRPGRHTARFGEIEQRGAALTVEGRARYDALLAQARDGGDGSYEERLARAFVEFPDTLDELRREGLAFFRYRLTDVPGGPVEGELDDWIAAGHVAADPITYEDFLPVSAAGIFRSNLGGEQPSSYAATEAKAAFEAALGAPVHDEVALYAELEAASIRRVRAAMREASGSALVE